MEKIDWSALSEKDLPLITEAFRRAMQRDSYGEPVLDRPPVVAIPETRLREIIREEIRQSRDVNMEECLRVIKREADEVFDTRLPKLFRQVGLNIDDDHIDETRRKFDDLFRMHDATRGFSREVIKAIGIWAAGLITAFLGYMGVKGGSH